MYVEQGREMVASRETREEEAAIRVIERRKRRIERAQEDLINHQQRDERERQRGIERKIVNCSARLNHWRRRGARHSVSTTPKRLKTGVVRIRSIVDCNTGRIQLRKTQNNDCLPLIRTCEFMTLGDVGVAKSSDSCSPIFSNYKILLLLFTCQFLTFNANNIGCNQI